MTTYDNLRLLYFTMYLKEMKELADVTYKKNLQGCGIPSCRCAGGPGMSSSEVDHFNRKTDGKRKGTIWYHAISGKSENHDKKTQNQQSLAKPLQSTNHRLSRITIICNGGLNHPASTTLAILHEVGHGRRFPSSIMKQIS